MTHGSKRGPKSGKPKNVPLPRISRMVPSRAARVKPSAIPSASSDGVPTEFREANASAGPG